MRKFARRLGRHFWWKMASLAIAVVLWISVGGEPEEVTIQAVPVLYRNLPSGLMMLIADQPDEIRLQLRGRSRTLDRASLEGIYASVDLAGVSGPGQQTFTLSQADFILPAGVSFVRAAPSQLRLGFDLAMTKDVLVQLHLTGAPAAGYRVVQQSVTPDHLSISGPQTRVAAITSAETDAVNINGLMQSEDVKVNAFLSDPRVQFSSPSVVTVHVTIEKTEQSQ